MHDQKVMRGRMRNKDFINDIRSWLYDAWNWFFLQTTPLTVFIHSMAYDSMENDHFFEPKSNKKKYSVDFDFRCLNERRYFKITMIRQKPTKQSYFKVDWPLISDRIVAFLLQFEMLNTSDFHISSRTSHFG